MFRFLPVVPCIIGLITSTVFGQVPADKALSTMIPAEDISVSLFAAEPMFVNPTSIDIDAKGRVWVCEAVNYRCKLRNKPMNRAEGDRIVVLEDTNGDGIADKAHTFRQSPELMAPLGIAVLHEAAGPGLKVYVCQSPDILVYEDKDGDLQADGPPSKLLTGFGGIDHDHGVHGILIGPDRKLYFTVGDAGVKNLQSRDGKGPKYSSNSTDCRAATVWRCELDGTKLELIAHNFRNNYEPAVESDGTVWLSDNDDDGNQQTRICYVMPGGNYGYHPRGKGESHWHEEKPGVVHKTLRTYFGSPTGMCTAEGSFLDPAKYTGAILHCDAGPRQVRAYRKSPIGAGYHLETDILLTSKDNWFRPSDVCLAPDGSIFIADWYDPGVGGHGMGDTTRGRIYRLTAKGSTGYKLPISDFTTHNLPTMLASPNLATRALAAESMRRLPTSDLLTLLKNAEGRSPTYVRHRIAWQIGIALTADPQSVFPSASDFLAAAPPESQALAIRLLADLKPDHLAQFLRSHGALEKLTTPARRELLLRGANLLPVADFAPVFYALAKEYDGKDHFYRAALNIAAGNDPVRRSALLAGFENHFLEWNDQVADLVWELRPSSILPKLEMLLKDSKLTDMQRGRIVDILAGNEDLEAGRTMLRLLGSGTAPALRTRLTENLKLILPTKWSKLRESTELTTAIDKLLSEPETAPDGLRLIAAAELTSAAPKVAALAKTALSPHVRLAAIRTLGELTDPKVVSVLRDLIRAKPDPFGLEAIRSLAEVLKPNHPGMKEAQSILEHLMLSSETPPEYRYAALEALAGTRPGTQWLLQTHSTGKFPEVLVADAGRLLRNSPFQDLRNKALLAFPAPGKLDPNKLPAITELVKRSGNVANGRQLFLASAKSELQCLKCHMVRGNGGQIGPDLSVIGKKASKENLYESILVPSKAIADQYLTHTVVTTKGLSVSGLFVQEDENTLILRDANGKDFSIAKKEIEERGTSQVSLMPNNLVGLLSQDQLIDLVEYLSTLKTPSLTPTQWHILGPFENGPNDSGLDQAFIDEKSTKIDLAATYIGKNGAKIGWRTVKLDGTGYIDLQAFHAPNSARSASYLYRRIESPVDQDAVFLIGNDDGAKLFLNGSQVFHDRSHVAAAPEAHKVRVRLQKGSNSILVKIVNGNDPHGLYLSIESEQELGLMTP